MFVVCPLASVASVCADNCQVPTYVNECIGRSNWASRPNTPSAHCTDTSTCKPTRGRGGHARRSGCGHKSRQRFKGIQIFLAPRWRNTQPRHRCKSADERVLSLYSGHRQTIVNYCSLSEVVVSPDVQLVSRSHPPRPAAKFACWGRGSGYLESCPFPNTCPARDRFYHCNDTNGGCPLSIYLVENASCRTTAGSF